LNYYAWFLKIFEICYTKNISHYSKIMNILVYYIVYSIHTSSLSIKYWLVRELVFIICLDSFFFMMFWLAFLWMFCQSNSCDLYSLTFYCFLFLLILIIIVRRRNMYNSLNHH
jgi:hypothetical protein